MGLVSALWLVVALLVVVVIGVLRRSLAVLEASAAGGPSSARVVGMPAGRPLPDLEVSDSDGLAMRLTELPGPLVLAVLTSHCQPCLDLAGRLAGADPQRLGGLVVLTDSGGREALSVPGPVRVLEADSANLASDLGIPGTPYVASVERTGLVRSAGILAGVEHLLGLLDGLPGELGKVGG